MGKSFASAKLLLQYSPTENILPKDESGPRVFLVAMTVTENISSSVSGKWRGTYTFFP
jgi:hypothetical protein